MLLNKTVERYFSGTSLNCFSSKALWLTLPEHTSVAACMSVMSQGFFFKRAVRGARFLAELHLKPQEELRMQNPVRVSAKNDVSLAQNDVSITTRQLAEQLGTRPNVITENAKKCLPNKKIENGKPTYWSKAEVTVLLEFMKSNNNRTDLDLSNRVIGTSTDLTPALRIRNAMLEMQAAYEDELAILRAKNAEKQAVIDRIADGTGCFSMNQTAKALKLPYGNIKLYERLRSEGILNSDNSPKQEQVNAGHFKVVVKFVNEKVGNKPVTLTTGRGLVYLAKRFNTQIDESVRADA